MIIDLYPKEKILKFNYALTLLQLGKYTEGILILIDLISLFQKGHNKNGSDADQLGNGKLSIESNGDNNS
jgi:predicted Zn-dependent protease